MTATAMTSPNSWTVTDSNGTTIGVVMLSSTGFTAMANGKLLGIFPTMAAAIAAITA